MPETKQSVESHAHLSDGLKVMLGGFAVQSAGNFIFESSSLRNIGTGIMLGGFALSVIEWLRNDPENTDQKGPK